MATAVVRVRGLTNGTLNHIDGLSEDIWVEWPAAGDTDSGPQIVGRFDEVKNDAVVLKWKREDGERGWLGIPMANVEAVITIKGSFKGRPSGGEEEDEGNEESEEREDDE